MRAIYSRTTFLGLCRGGISQKKTCLLLFIFIFLAIFGTLWALSNTLKPSFSTHSLKIHYVGLFRPEFFHHLGLGIKTCPYKHHYDYFNLNIYVVLFNYILTLFCEFLIYLRNFHYKFSIIFFKLLVEIYQEILFAILLIFCSLLLFLEFFLYSYFYFL